jgi:hypothetical protein
MSKLRTLSLCSALVLAIASAPTLAASASHEAKAERFLELVNADRLTVAVYAQVQQMFAQRFAEAQAPESRKAVLERYQTKADAELDKAIGWDKLKPEMVDLYAAEFSEKELAELIAFYQSPLGGKVLTKLPQLNAHSARLTQAKLEGAVPHVNKLLGEMMAELDTKKP